MVCDPRCDAAHYCDVILGDVCALCSTRCYTGQLDPQECKFYCPDVYRRMYEAFSTAVTTERAVPTVTVTLSEGLDNSFISKIIAIVLSVLVLAVFIGIMIYMYWCRRHRCRHHRGKESSSKTDQESPNASCGLTQSPDQQHYSPKLDQTHSNQAETTLSPDMSLPSTVASSSHENMPSLLFNNGAEFKSGYRVVRNSPKARDSSANIESRKPLLKQEGIFNPRQQHPHRFNIPNSTYRNNDSYPTTETSHNSLNSIVKESHQNVSPMLEDISVEHEAGMCETLQNDTEREPPPLTRTNTMNSSIAYNFVADVPGASPLSQSPPSLPAYSTPTEASSIDRNTRWAMVMKMYDAVDAQMHKFPFVAGCMIGGDALQVYVRTDQENTIESCYNQIKNILPQDPLVQELLIVQPE